MGVREIKKANGEVLRIIDGEYVIGANSGCFSSPSPCRKIINGEYLVEEECKYGCDAIIFNSYLNDFTKDGSLCEKFSDTQPCEGEPKFAIFNECVFLGWHFGINFFNPFEYEYDGLHEYSGDLTESGFRIKFNGKIYIPTNKVTNVFSNESRSLENYCIKYIDFTQECGVGVKHWYMNAFEVEKHIVRIPLGIYIKEDKLYLTEFESIEPLFGFVKEYYAS